MSLLNFKLMRISLFCGALMAIMGYDAKLYSDENWIANQADVQESRNTPK